MNEKPIFIQLMEMVEDGILSGAYKVGDLVISSTQICKLYNVNPATAIRALSDLADDGVLVKDRGIGMRVTEQAYEIIVKRRKKNFMESMLETTIQESKKLGLSVDELIKLIKEKVNG